MSARLDQINEAMIALEAEATEGFAAGDKLLLLLQTAIDAQAQIKADNAAAIASVRNEVGILLLREQGAINENAILRSENMGLQAQILTLYEKLTEFAAGDAKAEAETAVTAAGQKASEDFAAAFAAKEEEARVAREQLAAVTEQLAAKDAEFDAEMDLILERIGSFTAKIAVEQSDVEAAANGSIDPAPEPEIVPEQIVSGPTPEPIEVAGIEV